MCIVVCDVAHCSTKSCISCELNACVVDELGALDCAIVDADCTTSKVLCRYIAVVSEDRAVNDAVIDADCSAQVGHFVIVARGGNCAIVDEHCIFDGCLLHDDADDATNVDNCFNACIAKLCHADVICCGKGLAVLVGGADCGHCGRITIDELTADCAVDDSANCATHVLVTMH